MYILYKLFILHKKGDVSQQWEFSNTFYIKSKKYGTCIAMQPNPLVKEGNCANSDDWNVATWIYDNNTLLVDKVNNSIG